MISARRLILAHLWTAFAVFAVAAVLGAWQMWVRSPIEAPFATPENYYISVTAHGTAMAYVLTTFFIMGFGYYVAEAALERKLAGLRWAWLAYGLAVTGTAMAVLTVLSGRASVLYTFYPPLTASVFFYLGLVLVVAGSWIWCALMIVAMADLAAYYASLRRSDLDPAHPSFAGPEIETLVLVGDAVRALPPCAACHAAKAGGPLETPDLTGQSAAYVAAQLQAFADGSRRNDVFQRMRSIAAKLTPREKTLLGAYYTTPH